MNYIMKALWNLHYEKMHWTYILIFYNIISLSVSFDLNRWVHLIQKGGVKDYMWAKMEEM